VLNRAELEVPVLKSIFVFRCATTWLCSEEGRELGSTINANLFAPAEMV
jgi:hypothetical protein